MSHFILRLDLRQPGFGTDAPALYAAGIEMAQWADRRGFDEIMLSEHHGAEDGYLPSPLVYGAAIAARTARAKIRISALVLPLHDPVRVAEDVAVLDIISRGRIELVIAGGFLPSEFEMFGRALDERGQRIEQGVDLLKRVWRGEPVQVGGQELRVTPRPQQDPHPPILLGGSTPAAARRAARIADGFVPAIPELYPTYITACEALGRQPEAPRPLGPPFLHVSEDPDADWARIAPHALHETNSYGRWYAETGTAGPYEPISDADALRASGSYRVLTPERCVEHLRELGPEAWIFVHPLMGGMDLELGWRSLELLADQVIPALRA